MPSIAKLFGAFSFLLTTLNMPRKWAQLIFYVFYIQTSKDKIRCSKFAFY